jgi:hypothetical protein
MHFNFVKCKKQKIEMLFYKILLVKDNKDGTNHEIQNTPL